MPTSASSFRKHISLYTFVLFTRSYCTSLVLLLLSLPVSRVLVVVAVVLLE